MTSMKIACIGGGPAGLFFSIVMKTRRPDADITVHERNRRGDTFGFGVVFSDETMGNIAAADPPSVRAIEAEFRSWSAMDVRVQDRHITSDGHGFAALARVRLLEILTARAAELGVHVRFQDEVGAPGEVGEVDLVVGADGVNSRIRGCLAEHLQPHVTMGDNKFIWTGTTAPFERFTFVFEPTEHGWVQAHVYPFDGERSTFIVEMAGPTWRAAGLSGHGGHLTPGQSDAHAIAWCERVFADHLGGCGLIGNNSKWLSFPRVSSARWTHDNVVMLGDAVHTAHYSIGSGTKLALEDAIALADAVDAHPDLDKAFAHFEASRRPVVESLQRAASTSESWFEHVDRHARLPFEQFAFSLFTRSQRVTYDNLARRDPGYADKVKQWYFSSRPSEQHPTDPSTAPLFYPFVLREMRLTNRIVVSPIAQYSAVDGTPDDWHLVHLGSRAVGGAGLVMTGMAATSPDARITSGDTGLWNDKQADAWSRVTDFVHAYSESKIGVQLGHAGRRGSVPPPWDQVAAPLTDANWPLVSASPIPFTPSGRVPEQLSVSGMNAVVADFEAATARAVASGFDLVEIQAAHGFLLSSFLSPITNQRDDDFGGSLENRARFPLRVIDAVRRQWPDDKPLSVRISATDWIEGGFDGDQAIAFSEMLQRVGVDIVDVSTGEVDAREQPAYGRLYQTPFSEAIRNTVGVATMAVGAISSIDDVNTILLAGRADLCCIGRPHLIDPYWSLNAALDVGERGQPWPRQYLDARQARRRDQAATR